MVADGKPSGGGIREYVITSTRLLISINLAGVRFQTGSKRRVYVYLKGSGLRYTSSTIRFMCGQNAHTQTHTLVQKQANQK